MNCENSDSEEIIPQKLSAHRILPGQASPTNSAVSKLSKHFDSAL